MGKARDSICACACHFDTVPVLASVVRKQVEVRSDGRNHANWAGAPGRRRAMRAGSTGPAPAPTPHMCIQVRAMAHDRIRTSVSTGGCLCHTGPGTKPDRMQ